MTLAQYGNRIMDQEWLATHSAEIQVIADLFLRAGATCVCFVQDDNVLLSEPTGATPSGESFLSRGENGFGLRVYGMVGPFQQACADVIAKLFSDLLNGDAELDSLTIALIEAQDRLVALYDLSKATRNVLEIPLLLEYLTRETCNLLDILGAFAIVLLPGSEPIIRQSGKNALSMSQIIVAEQYFRPVSEPFQSKQSKTIPVSLQNVFMVTIPVRQGVFASLGFYNSTGKFTTPDIKLAKSLAEQAGAQLENILLLQEALARTRMETEMNIARQVQMALLPQSLPIIPGIDLYATSNPALEVGGDFFDLISLPDGRLIFLLGDVTGKGMPAALLMSMARTVLHTAARHMNFSDPNQLMIRLNDDLSDDFSRVGMFTTVFIGSLQSQTGCLSMCNAGQSPILYLPSAGAPVMMEAQDIPVGIFDGYPYSTSLMNLSAGDVFVVASDGFPESRDPGGEMFGYQRIQDILVATHDLTAREIGDALLSAVDTFSGEHAQDDDRTLIILKMK